VDSTAGNVKLLLPPRQSRGNSHHGLVRYAFCRQAFEQNLASVRVVVNSKPHVTHMRCLCRFQLAAVARVAATVRESTEFLVAIDAIGRLCYYCLTLALLELPPADN
jgi:hypothetical protein